MQTGVINSDNVAQILRNIAQKRQNGGLEILQGDDKLNLLFYNGKIVDAYKESESAVSRAARRLEKAGESASEEQLRLIVRHEVLNFLFNLDLSNQSIFSFKNFMPEFDKNYAANISIGQYLLDKASLDSESKKFNQMFMDDPVIMKLDLAGLELTEDEQSFYSSLKERMRLSQIFEESIFNRYHIVTNLLSFYERAVIEIEHGDREVDLDLTTDKNIINFLEDSSVRPFVEGHLEPAADELNVKNEPSQETVVEEEKVEMTQPAIKVKPEKKSEPNISPAPKKTKKCREPELAPRIILAVYLVSFLSIVLMTWRTYLSGF